MKAISHEQVKPIPSNKIMRSLDAISSFMFPPFSEPLRRLTRIKLISNHPLLFSWFHIFELVICFIKAIYKYL